MGYACGGEASRGRLRSGMGEDTNSQVDKRLGEKDCVAVLQAKKVSELRGDGATKEDDLVVASKNRHLSPHEA